MTSIFEARRAGQMPARTPAMPAAIRTTMMPTTGIAEDEAVVLERLDCGDRDAEPDHGADQGADHRRDQRLVADHPADLRLRGADRAQHPDLARPLVDRQDEGVDDAEEADDHRQRQQHVDQRQQLVDPVLLLLLELLLVARLGLREAVREQLVDPVARSRRRRRRARSRRGSAKSWRASNCFRSVSIGSARLATRSWTRSRTLPSIADRDLLAGRRLQRQRVADRDAVVLGPLRLDDRLVGAEAGQRRSRRRRPSRAWRPSSACRVEPGDQVLLRRRRARSRPGRPRSARPSRRRRPSRPGGRCRARSARSRRCWR